MVFKIGDKVRITQTAYDWRKPYVNKVGVICKEAASFDWLIDFGKDTLPFGCSTRVCWDEEDFELTVQIGEQLLFPFMKE